VNDVVRTLHRRAEQAVDAATLARGAGDARGAQAALAEALELERRAAELTPDDVEPTHSCLYLGAATLALECGDYEEAARLATVGLAGRPSANVRAHLERITRANGWAVAEAPIDEVVER
jgi:hypothetical protein